MRVPALALLAVGLAGVVVGVVQLVQSATGENAVPFTYETEGGPGPLLAGVILVLSSLVLLGYDRRH